MEKSNKLMLGAALVVALVALAGAGYAATSAYYTATTTNSGNSLDTTYITLSQTGDDTIAYGTGSILTDIKFDTENPNGTITYKPIATHTMSSTYVFTGVGAEHKNTGSADDTTYVALISKALTLQLGVQGSAADETAYTLTVTPTAGALVSGLDYVMILQSGSEGIQGNVGHDTLSGSDTNWTFTIDSSNVTNGAAWTVYIFATGASTTTTPETGTVTFDFELKAEYEEA